MGIDYSSAGGIGISIDDYIEEFIEHGAFSEEEWDEAPYECANVFDTPYDVGGSAYTGKEFYYLLVDGSNLEEVIANAPEFIEKIKKFGVELEFKDLKVISDYHV